MAEVRMSLPEWLRSFGGGAVEQNADVFKGTGLSADSFAIVNQGHSDSGEAIRFVDSTEQTLNKLQDFQVRQVGEDSNNSYWEVRNPNGKTQKMKLKVDRESTFDKFMYSGAPIALMAGPLGAAMGLTGASAAMAGGAVTGGLQGLFASGGNLKTALKGAAAGGVGGATAMIPGISSLGAAGQGAVAGGLRSLVTGGNGKEALLAALTGAASGGMAQGGVNPLVRQLAIAQLRSRLMPRRG